MMTNKLILTCLSAFASLATTSAQEVADTTIVLNYGYEVVDTITVSRTSDTFLQIQEAVDAIPRIADNYTKSRAVVKYILSHPDSDGSVYVLDQVGGINNGRKCLAAISERVRTGTMKRLYDAYAAGMHEVDSLSAPTAAAIPVGEEFKDFTLEDINGQQLSLSSLRGKYVLLDFWASWCGPCVASFPTMKAFYEQKRDKLEILGIAVHDKKDAWKAAVEKHQLPWKLVFDAEDDNSLAKRCSLIGVPTYVLLDPEGKILMWTMAGLDNVEDYLE